MPLLRYELTTTNPALSFGRYRTKHQVIQAAYDMTATYHFGIDQCLIHDRKLRITFKPAQCCRRCCRALKANESVMHGMGMTCYLKSPSLAMAPTHTLDRFLEMESHD